MATKRRKPYRILTYYGAHDCAALNNLIAQVCRLSDTRSYESQNARGNRVNRNVKTMLKKYDATFSDPGGTGIAKFYDEAQYVIFLLEWAD